MALYIKLFDFIHDGSYDSVQIMDAWIHQTELGKRLRLINLIQEL